MREKNDGSRNKRIVTLTATPGSPLWQIFVELEKTGIDLHAQILQTVLIYHLPLSLTSEDRDSTNKAISSVHKLQAQAAIISDLFGLRNNVRNYVADENIARSNNLASMKKSDRDEDCFDAQLIEVSEQQNQGSDRVNALGWDG